MTLGLPDLRGPPTAGIVGALFVTIVVAGTVLAPLFTPFDPLALGTGTLLPPSLAHPLGTDDLGRDGLARVLYGGRVPLSIGLFSAAISVIVGMTVGMVAGFFGGALDEVLMRITEAFQILPKLLVAVVVVSMIGSGLTNEILVIGLLSWPATARGSSFPSGSGLWPPPNAGASSSATPAGPVPSATGPDGPSICLSRARERTPARLRS